MSSAFRTPEGFNQPLPLVRVTLFAADPALVALLDAAPQAVADELAAFGQYWGSADVAELARLANENAPRLRTHDAGGTRLDAVEFHPAYHALMRRSVAAGLHCSVWDAGGDEGPLRTMVRAARLYLAAQLDTGHLGPLSSTNAAIAALAHQPQLAEAWLPGIRSRKYDQTARPAREKSGSLLGLALTERHAGSDQKACSTIANRSDERLYRLSGTKWFVAGPMSDGFVTLAQSQEGLSAFLLPRFLPDGSRNAIRLLRLKERIGGLSGAIGEFELEGAGAMMIGQPGQGMAVIGETQTLARLDAAVMAAALMRMAVAEAIHHARQRKVSGTVLVAQPIMARVLADMALDSIAATALVFRLAESFDRAHDDPNEAAFVRLMTPVTKYWVGKAATPLLAEAMECVGGNATVADSRLARLYRAAPELAIGDGPGNVLCLEVLRVLRKSSDPLEAVLAMSENALGDAARTTINVLRAATAVALADEGSARILTEQLAMTVAAAALRRSFPSVIADAFVETRLGKQWRTTYGMLDSRFDAAAFINYVMPKG